ncbi:kinase-like domain-containing protein [Aspergillus egyptiacus]|nr:kinase-like domain-containing protein [Aspergillus egyptiacus]
MSPTLRRSLLCALQSPVFRPPSLLPCISRPSLTSRPHSATISTACTADKSLRREIEPHAYTSGRWLRHDRQELELRYIPFNFGALCQKVIELCPRARSIQACEKVEGGFNRVFIFTLNNAKKIVAKLPFRLARPAKLTTISEVATMCYLQSKTNIPIPQVLAYHPDAADQENIVGSEYIIMEHAAGVPLNKRWHQMAGDQRVRCIKAICQTMKESVDLQFPAFGSIYFDRSLDSAGNQSLGDGFCVGPHCSKRYWNTDAAGRGNYQNAKYIHGPWSSITEYRNGLIDAGLSHVPPVDTELERRPFYHGSPESHVALLERARPVLRQMCADTRISHSATPLLFHPDLHMRNILVSEDDPCTVTSIIDWQAASIEPAFWYADETPDFATENEIFYQAFDLSSQFFTPRLAAPRLMDENLFRPFRYCYRTWKDGAVAFRHEMIQTARLWNQLGDELEQHEREYRLFGAAQQLQSDLAEFLNTATDGWVPPEDFERVQVAHKELFEGMLQHLLTKQDPYEDEPVRDERTLRSIWPFDID